MWIQRPTSNLQFKAKEKVSGPISKLQTVMDLEKIGYFDLLPNIFKCISHLIKR